MNFLTSLTQQLGILLESQSAARRIILLAIILFSIGGLFWLTGHARTGSYMVLFDNLPTGDGPDASVILGKSNISSRLEDGGKRLKVPVRHSNEAMMLLAEEGIPSLGSTGYEGLDRSGIGQSKLHQENNFHRMHEGELARSIMTLTEIERARVHLAIPKKTLFVTEEEKPTASVALKLRRGARLTDRQVNGIVHLISNAVEGLHTENISIIDSRGDLLTSGVSSTGDVDSGRQLTYKNTYEEGLKKKIESMLEEVLGKGKVIARVNAEFDYTRQHEVKELYNPDEQDQIITRESRKDYLRAPRGSSGGAIGAPGSDAIAAIAGDISTGAVTSGPGGANSKFDIIREFAVSKQTLEHTINTPQPTGISVAVLVDHSYEETEAEYGTITRVSKKRDDYELEQIEELIKTAIGFTKSKTRTDQVTVISMPFQIDEFEMTEASWFSLNMRQFVGLGIEWGVMGLIGLLLILVVLRPAVKQIMVTPAVETPRLPGNKPMIDEHIQELAALPKEERDKATVKLEELRERAGIEGEMDEQLVEELLQSANLSEDESQAIKKVAVAQLYNNPEKIQSLLAQQANVTQANAQKKVQELVETVKHNPANTVSLLRQWMEEG
jgi:flagellar M-ring protein FliF